MFDTYIALGDSMSIDLYPARDAESAGVSTREELGAASLFYRNDNSLFPEFEGLDLSSWFPGIQFHNLAIDGATCEDILSEVRIKELTELARGRVLATLTLGGNDLLQSFRRSAGRDQATLLSEFMKVKEQYPRVLRLLTKKLPECVFIVSNIFDPTDGTGIIPSSNPIYKSEFPIEFLERFNQFIKTKAHSNSTQFADVHQHFLGHGAECGASDNFWYWKPSPIEPSLRGANEIRRVWVQTLQEYRNGAK